MKATGIVVEYNPFHNGHLLHATESRKITNNEILVAVMSGPFLQRGEPSLVSKWARAEMALKAGVDIVIELPYAFAAQHATHFASGAVRLLDAIGCDSLCFGSEDGTVEPFIERMNWRKENLSLLDEKIKFFNTEGLSYPAAVAKSYEVLNEQNPLSLDLSLPNNMLGLQYVEAINQYAQTIKPYTIKRQKSGYHESELHTEKISSATSIRKAIFESSLPEINDHLPETTYQILDQYYRQFGQYHHWENYWPLLQFKLLSHTHEELRDIYEIEEGIEYRLTDAAKISTSFSDFMKSVKTKRYTWTRIQRMLTHLLTHTKKEEMIDLNPSYIRLLGMNKNGRAYLNKHKKDFSLPMISRVGREDEEMLSLDLRANRIYAMGLQNPMARKKMLLADFNHPPVMLD
ncbi:nucleotidyltransferase [Jeotgalibacillus sp. S-D1]|uniref:nucleotidyltransferase n=1 Tax=Jeotgalibacillus sp. S-D1 TaxID=2552189 RepID=UPI00105A12E2|nr:nucleotidyltransferase [Jeotgalibacillus sp. S-D1]TDL35140.1 nucleotidyltransferase [Jeotgalibacillus sp. S-D1]